MGVSEILSSVLLLCDDGSAGCGWANCTVFAVVDDTIEISACFKKSGTLDLLFSTNQCLRYSAT